MVSLSVPWQQDRRRRGIAPLILNSGTRWKSVADSTSLMLFLEKNWPVPPEQEAGWIWCGFFGEKLLFIDRKLKFGSFHLYQLHSPALRQFLSIG